MARVSDQPRTDVAVPVPIEYPLVLRTRALLERFDREDRSSYAFGDSGDGTQYAEWFADLLDEWLEASVVELDI